MEDLIWVTPYSAQKVLSALLIGRITAIELSRPYQRIAYVYRRKRVQRRGVVVAGVADAGPGPPIPATGIYPPSEPSASLEKVGV